MYPFKPSRYISSDYILFGRKETVCLSVSVLSMGSTSLCNLTMIFPNRKTDVMNWVKATRNSIRIPCVSSEFFYVLFRHYGNLLD